MSRRCVMPAVMVGIVLSVVGVLRAQRGVQVQDPDGDVVLKAMPAPQVQTEVMDTALLDGDEEKVAALIQQLAAKDFKEREAAQKQLAGIGPASLPMLLPHAKSGDPEVRMRVNKLLGQHRYVTTGAILTSVDPKSSPPAYAQREGGRLVNYVGAAAVGLKVGDVIVKIDTKDIDGRSGVDIYRANSPQQVLVLREGKLLRIGIGGYRLCGMGFAAWDAAKGGFQQSQGIAALYEGNYPEAQKRLAAAVDGGLDEPLVQQMVACLAAWNLDDATALKYYTAFRQKSCPGQVGMAWGDLPIRMDVWERQADVHTAWLAKTFNDARLKPDDRISIGWFHLNQARNSELAAKYILPALPAGADIDSKYRQIECMLMMGRDAEAVACFLREPRLRGYDLFPSISTAMLRAGQYKALADLFFKAPSEDDLDLMFRLLPFAEAAGDKALTDRIYRVLGRLDMIGFTAFASRARNIGLNRRCCAEQLARYFNSRMKLNPAAAAQGLLMVAGWAPITEKVDMEVAYRATRGGSNPLSNVDWLICLVRTGQFENAAKVLAAIRGMKNFRSTDLGSYDALIQFMQQNKDKLAGEYQALNGAIKLYKTPAGATFVIHSNGQVYVIDKDGKLHPTPGVDPDAPPGRIYSYPTGSIYVGREQIYWWDQANLKWLPSYVGTGDYPSEQVYAHPEAPLAVGHVAKNYPVDGYGRHLAFHRRTKPGWVVWVFWGDVVIAVNPKDSKLVDLSAEIAKAAGKPKPARVYRPRELADRLLVPSEVGLWTLDGAGQLARVELPGAKPDGPAVVLDWPKKDGSLYVGVPPQHGGQVFEYDLAGSKCTAVAGAVKGIGPLDSMNLVVTEKYRITWMRSLEACYALEKISRQHRGGR